jgi:ligand-binding SRPBCC domain-containing protein
MLQSPDDMPRLHTFHSTLELPLPREQVFPFFADAANLQVITPPELSFRIVTPSPIEMRDGALIRYRLRLLGVPFGWLTRIVAWDPPHRFVDEQIKGPYAVWIHTHTFTDTPAGTRIEDEVTYGLPLYPLGEVASPLVRLQVRRIFAYRTAAIRRAFHCQ